MACSYWDLQVDERPTAPFPFFIPRRVVVLFFLSTLKSLLVLCIACRSLAPLPLLKRGADEKQRTVCVSEFNKNFTPFCLTLYHRNIRPSFFQKREQVVYYLWHPDRLELAVQTGPSTITCTSLYHKSSLACRSSNVELTPVKTP